MASTSRERQFIRRSEPGFEQIVMGEVLIPDTPNTEGDIYTRENIRDFAYAFAAMGLNSGVGNDVEHDNVDRTGDVYVIESFIARENDPDFIEGSWVVAMKITDPDLWQQVLDGEINGFSYEALAELIPVKIENLRSRVITGITSPDPIDGHTHSYAVVVDALNKPVKAAVTGETDGHTHLITTHTITGTTNGHTHRFDVIDDGENDDN